MKHLLEITCDGGVSWHDFLGHSRYFTKSRSANLLVILNAHNLIQFNLHNNMFSTLNMAKWTYLQMKRSKKKKSKKNGLRMQKENRSKRLEIRKRPDSLANLRIYFLSLMFCCLNISCVTLKNCVSYYLKGILKRRGAYSIIIEVHYKVFNF